MPTAFPRSHLNFLKTLSTQQAEHVGICCAYDIKSRKCSDLWVPVFEIPLTVCLSLIHMKWLVLEDSTALREARDSQRLCLA